MILTHIIDIAKHKSHKTDSAMPATHVRFLDGGK